MTMNRHPRTQRLYIMVPATVNLQVRVIGVARMFAGGALFFFPQKVDDPFIVVDPQYKLPN